MTVASEHQPWRALARCKALTEEESDRLFFIGKGKSPKAAKTFCEGCPVRQQCLEYAIVHHERGIWAGLTESERDALAPLVASEFFLKVEAAGTLETRDSINWLSMPNLLNLAS